MNHYPSIRIEGAILSPDILDHLDELAGQRPADFGLPTNAKVKDEIARAWADAQDYWRIFQRKLESLRPDNIATTETRQQWVIPLLGLLGYQLEFQAKGAVIGDGVSGKSFPLSHRIANRGHMAVHIVGYKNAAGLDRKADLPGSPRMSAHAMLQEYLNLSDELYGLVTNGRVLRLLRDSSRLIKLTYLEFDLDRIFTDGLFADFALLYRLLHATRLPANQSEAAQSLIERYHQDSLDSGSRIRDGLSKAVESALKILANGFLQHPHNEALRRAIKVKQLTEPLFYQHLLRLIYRLLFLMVIEERGLVYPPGANPAHRRIYEQFYSVQRLRRLSEKRYLADKRYHDHWLALVATFRLFDASGIGEKLGLAPLAGDLFNASAIGTLAQCSLGNDALMTAMAALNAYVHPSNGQRIRVNYGALNVEEFGSVYEGLLDYQPAFLMLEGRIEFAFNQSDQRAATGSHYTPDELVQPLIKHSLDYLIADKLKTVDPASALLSLRVADISCGSGHILLAAARRIAIELAIVRTGEEQPSPSAYRTALRDTIRHCIFGVDLNPLAVELCKVALWLEAHVPGEPLNFLDHHIKCGNAIVGYARREDIERGVPDEAFTTLPGDAKPIAAALRKQNKTERIAKQQSPFAFTPERQTQLDHILADAHHLDALPEQTPAQIEVKRQRFLAVSTGEDALRMEQLAAIPIAQFYLHRTPEFAGQHITDGVFRQYWNNELPLTGQAPAAAWATSHQKRFFHWFLEFPEVMANGGFDCILGNPPYKGGQALSGEFGHDFCEFVRWSYAPTGLSDLVVFFVRRIFTLLRPGGFTAFITTNSIKDGDIRKDGLEQLIAQGAAINMVVRGTRWPGVAKLVVSHVALHRGQWLRERLLDGRSVTHISPYFEDHSDVGEPKVLLANANRTFQGSIFLGDGFLLSHEQAAALVDEAPSNSAVVRPTINGDEINNHGAQLPQRSVINFQSRSEAEARLYPSPFAIVEEKVRPGRLAQSDDGGKEFWWRFLRPRNELYSNIQVLSRCFVAAATTKYLNFSAAPTNYVFLNTLYVFTTDRWDLYAVVQSTLHEVWARKYSGALKQDLRYSPSKCFDTFAFPGDLWRRPQAELADIGERYHEHRKRLMRSLWLGLTDIYNLFHARELEVDLRALYASRAKKDPQGQNIPAEHREAALLFTFDQAAAALHELRRLHVELDTTIRDVYGWQDLNLEHGFVEVETLPENDRVRYTVSPAVRKELLKRLLALNHERAAEETAAAPVAVKKVKRKKADDETTDLPL